MELALKEETEKRKALETKLQHLEKLDSVAHVAYICCEKLKNCLPSLFLYHLFQVRRAYFWIVRVCFLRPNVLPLKPGMPYEQPIRAQDVSTSQGWKKLFSSLAQLQGSSGPPDTGNQSDLSSECAFSMWRRMDAHVLSCQKRD